MVEFKIVVGSKGKSYSKSLTEIESSSLLNKKIMDRVEGKEIGLLGYELQITGGSDNAGFPMRYDLDGSGRKQILLTKGPCVKIKRKGMRKIKTVVGNTISQITSQVNLKVTKERSEKLDKIFGKEEAPAEEQKKEAKEEKKEQPK